MDALSRLPAKELDKEHEIEELHRLKKVHDNSTMLPMSFSAIDKRQKDRNQYWKDAIVEKRGRTTLKVTEVGKIIGLSTLQEELMSWYHEKLKKHW